MFGSKAKERRFLGECMADPKTIKTAKRAELSPAELDRDEHRWIYRVMLDLDDHDKEINCLTVCDELKAWGKLSLVGGPAYIVGLYQP